MVLLFVAFLVLWSARPLYAAPMVYQGIVTHDQLENRDTAPAGTEAVVGAEVLRGTTESDGSCTNVDALTIALDPADGVTKADDKVDLVFDRNRCSWVAATVKSKRMLLTPGMFDGAQSVIPPDGARTWVSAPYVLARVRADSRLKFSDGWSFHSLFRVTAYQRFAENSFAISAENYYPPQNYGKSVSSWRFLIWNTQPYWPYGPYGIEDGFYTSLVELNSGNNTWTQPYVWAGTNGRYQAFCYLGPNNAWAGEYWRCTGGRHTITYVSR